MDSRLPISMESLLHQVVNILLAGNAPTTLSPYLAGGNLTSLLKSKGTGWDVRPIAVGEILRRLVGKCACILTKEKASQFFNPFQFGVACPAGTEKIVHKLRQVIEDNWNNGDFAILKVDMRNAFNLVSLEAVLHQCAIHFPELLPWVTWCYSQHQKLWHPMGQLISASGVQQGYPLGPLDFYLLSFCTAPFLKSLLTPSAKKCC